MQSPLNNISASCQVCHREETATLIQNVYDRQDKVIEARRKLEKALVRAHIEAAKAWEFLKLDMTKFRNEKTIFLKEIVPAWEKAAAERESK